MICLFYFSLCLESAVEPDDLTPSISYIGDPVNNRLAFMIISSVAIPVTWTSAYVGLYLYFKDVPSFIQFHPQNKVFRTKLNLFVQFFFSLLKTMYTGRKR